MHRAVAPGPGYSAAIAMPGSCQGAARSPPPRRAAPSSSRGHGQVPNASMDAQSMSTTITFRSDGAGLRSPLVAAAMDHSVAGEPTEPCGSFCELVQGAAKYGSLSAAGGHVEVSWSLTADGRLSLRWIESGGPTATPPTHRGFGTRIMENMIGQLKGEVRFDWRDQGLTCEIALPLA
jgi:hypothetical protein